jgi:FixJ family two-component response regulator
MQRVARKPPLGLPGLFNDGSVEADEPAKSTGEEPMAPRDDAQPTVIVIDDDRDVREALDNLVRSIGLRAKLFGSVHEFLGAGHTDRPGCLVLDVRLPGRSGLDFHDDLVKANVHLPVIFISGFADVPMSVRALKAGAVEFLTKPFRQQDLLEAIQLAVERDRARREHESAAAGLRASYGTLTPRESEVMLLVAAGRLNKQIAGELGLTEATVKVHRSQAMRKMDARSVADLVRMADKLGLAPNTAIKTPAMLR